MLSQCPFHTFESRCDRDTCQENHNKTAAFLAWRTGTEKKTDLNW